MHQFCAIQDSFFDFTSSFRSQKIQCHDNLKLLIQERCIAPIRPNWLGSGWPKPSGSGQITANIGSWLFVLAPARSLTVCPPPPGIWPPSVAEMCSAFRELGQVPRNWSASGLPGSLRCAPRSLQPSGWSIFRFTSSFPVPGSEPLQSLRLANSPRGLTNSPEVRTPLGQLA